MDEEMTQAAAPPSLLSDGLTMTLIVIVVLIAAIYAVYKLTTVAGRLSKEASEEERKFELQAIQSTPMAPVAMASATTEAVLEPPSDEPAGIPPLAALPAIPARDDLEMIGSQLAALGIVGELQGRIPMPLPPDGRIYALKKGGSCAILPRLESCELMEHYCKRFDLIVLRGPAGELLVMERFQGRLPSLLDSFPAKSASKPPQSGIDPMISHMMLGG